MHETNKVSLSYLLIVLHANGYMPGFVVQKGSGSSLSFKQNVCGLLVGALG